MGKTYDIVALGELLVDFTPAGISENGMLLFERNPGGAPVNMLTAAKIGGEDCLYRKSGKRHAWPVFKGYDRRCGN